MCRHTFLAEAVCSGMSLATVKLAEGPVTKFLMRCMVLAWLPLTGARARRVGVLVLGSCIAACCLATASGCCAFCFGAELPMRKTLLSIV